MCHLHHPTLFPDFLCPLSGSSLVTTHYVLLNAFSAAFRYSLDLTTSSLAWSDLPCLPCRGVLGLHHYSLYLSGKPQDSLSLISNLSTGPLYLHTPSLEQEIHPLYQLNILFPFDFIPPKRFSTSRPNPPRHLLFFSNLLYSKQTQN